MKPQRLIQFFTRTHVTSVRHFDECIQRYVEDRNFRTILKRPSQAAFSCAGRSNTIAVGSIFFVGLLALSTGSCGETPLPSRTRPGSPMHIAREASPSPCDEEMAAHLHKPEGRRC